MTAEQEEWLGRVKGLIISIEDQGLLPSSECSEAAHLVEHGEPGEGLRHLAWVIVDEGTKVPAEVIDTIETLSKYIVLPEDMPPNLRDHAV